jgi:hypothetical protein
MHRLRCFYIIAAAVLMPFVAIQLLGTTVAWSTPASYFATFKAADALLLGLMLWDAFVIFGVAYGIPALVVLLVLRGICVIRSLPDIVLFVFAGIVALRLAPIYLGTPLIWPSEWWHLGPELTYVLVGVAGVVALRLWPNNSFKPTPLRGAA